MKKKAESESDRKNHQSTQPQQQTESSTPEQINKRDFNLTEEIEKLYNSRQIENDTSSYQKEDNYVDEHNADYYETSKK